MSSRGITVTLDTNRRLMTTRGIGLQFPGPVAVANPHSGERCEGERTIGEFTGESKTLLGFEVLRYWDKDLIGDTDEEWLAPELGCEPLDTTRIQVGDSPLTIIQVATRATTDPPPDSEFEIPEGFKEVPPSEFSPEINRNCACPSRRESADQMYFRDKSMREGVLDPRLTDPKYVEEVRRDPRFKDKDGSKPFSIWYHARSAEPNGKVTESDWFLGGRANGDQIQRGASGAPTVFNFQYSRGIVVFLNADKKWTTTLGGGLPAPFMPLGSKCEGFYNATGGSKMILGFQAFEYRQEIDEGDRKSLIDTWRAPALNCELLEESSTWIDGNQMTSQARIATAASTEPPLDTEFDIPAGYREVPPWEAQSRSCCSRVDDQQYLRDKSKREGALDPRLTEPNFIDEVRKDPRFTKPR